MPGFKKWRSIDIFRSVVQFQTVVRIFRCAICLAVFNPLSAFPGNTPQDKYDRLEKAAVLIRDGQLATAEAELQTLLRQAPNDANALNLLGVIRVQQKQSAEAEKLFLTAIRNSPNFSGAYINLGHLYVDLRNPERARWAYNEASKLAPKDKNINYQLALLYEEAGDFGKVLAQLDKTPQASWEIQEYYLAAKSYLALQQTDKALAIVSSLEQTNLRDDDQAAAAFASTLIKNNLTREAISFLERSITRNPNSAALNYRLAASYARINNWSKAEEFYKKSLELDPANVATMRELAHLARSRGELERALAYLVQARKVASNDPAVLYDFAVVAFNMNLILDALPIAERLYTQNGDEPRYVHLLAVCRFRHDEKAEAEKLLRRYIQLRPGDSVGYYLLGVTQFSVKRFAEAREWLQKSLSFGDNPDSKYMLGLIAQTEGDNATAIRWLKTIDASASCYASAQTILGVAYAEQDDLPSARTTLERAVKLNPGDLRAHYQLGLIYSKLGEKELAGQMFAIADQLREQQRKEEVTSFKLIDPP